LWTEKYIIIFLKTYYEFIELINMYIKISFWRKNRRKLSTRKHCKNNVFNCIKKKFMCCK